MLSVSDQLCHLCKLHFGFLVRIFQITGHHSGDQKYLLSVMVKRDNLVKKHEIHVPEIFYCFIGKLKLRLAVFNVIVGEISYQTASECRHFFEYRALVFFQDLSNCFSRMLYLLLRFLFGSVFMNLTDLKISIRTGDLHRWFISQEGIPSPHLCLAGTFQQVTVSAGCAKSPHHFYGCITVGIQLSAYGNAPVFA